MARAIRAEMAAAAAVVATEHAQRCYRRMMARWAADLLASRQRIVWPEPDPTADHRNRDWTVLYRGSVLDD